MTKPRIPYWLQKPEGDEPPTSQQIEKLLAAADSDIALAEGLEAAARAKESSERTVSAVEAAENAMAETARLRRFRAILRDDLEKSRKREHEAELQRLRERKVELEALLSHESLVEAAAPLVTEEVAALRKVAEIRAERRRLHDEKEKLAHELHGARHRLGENPPMMFSYDPVSAILDHGVVCEAIDAMRRAIGEETWVLLDALKPDRDTYSLTNRVIQAFAAAQELRRKHEAGR